MHTNLTAVSLFILSAIYPLRWDDDAPPMADERREEVLYDTVATLLLPTSRRLTCTPALLNNSRRTRPVPTHSRSSSGLSTPASTQVKGHHAIRI